MKKKSAGYEKVNPIKNYPVNIYKFCFSEEQERDMPRHWHNSLEITYHVHADGVLFVEGKKQLLKGNVLTLINSNCIHEIHTHVTDQSNSLVLLIPDEFLKAGTPDYEKIEFFPDEQDEEIIRLMNEMYDVSESDDQFSSLKITALTYELIYYLCRCCMHYRDGYHAPSPKSWTQNVSDYLHENYSNIQSLQDISDHFGYSREAFCRKFHKVFSCTLHQYLTRLRLREALKHLRESDETFSNIAVNAGFSSLRSMNSYMLSYTGYSPSGIRELSDTDYWKLLEAGLL